MPKAPVELSESVRERLGRVSDGVLAIEAGVSAMTISRKRRELGIPAANEKPVKAERNDLRTAVVKAIDSAALTKGGFLVSFENYMALCKAASEWEGE
jgi:hypothetical protein